VKVLIFSAFDPIPSDNISPIRYAHLAEEFLHHGHEVEYITSYFFHLKKTFRKAKDWSDIGTPKNLKLTKIATPSYRNHVGLRRLYSHFILARNLKSYLDKLKKEDEPALIICAYPPISANYYLARWTQKKKIPYILDIQDLWPFNFNQFVPLANKIILSPLKSKFRYIISHAAALAPVCGDYMRYIPVKYQKKPNHVFRLGIESELFPALSKNNAGNKNFELLYIGTGSTNKLLLKAIEAIRNLNGVNLHIIGLREYSYEIEKYLEENNIKNIRITPWLNQNDLKEEAVKYDAALLLVNPNSLIYFPNKAFAYFASGLPVISNIRGGELEEIIAENNFGITIKDDTEKSIQEAVYALQADKDVSNRMRIQQFARKNFDSESIYKAYYIWAMQVYKGIQ
jgi:glycosyltransferase involved in cell wall biosynthesis